MSKLADLKRYALTPVIDLINHKAGIESDVAFNYFYGYFSVTTQVIGWGSRPGVGAARRLAGRVGASSRLATSRDSSVIPPRCQRWRSSPGRSSSRGRARVMARKSNDKGEACRDSIPDRAKGRRFPSRGRRE